MVTSCTMDPPCKYTLFALGKKLNDRMAMLIIIGHR
jgi:hypothetical protein